MSKAITSIAAGEFKAKCLQIMDNVSNHHQSVLITKRGKPVAKLMPIDEQPLAIYGKLQGSINAYADIIQPIDESWNANE